MKLKIHLLLSFNFRHDRPHTIKLCHQKPNLLVDTDSRARGQTGKRKFSVVYVTFSATVPLAGTIFFLRPPFVVWLLSGIFRCVFTLFAFQHGLELVMESGLAHDRPLLCNRSISDLQIQCRLAVSICLSNCCLHISMCTLWGMFCQSLRPKSQLEDDDKPQ